jgi:5-methylcytosine-specific restriction protein A
MPNKAGARCSTPGCPHTTNHPRGRCTECRTRAPTSRAQGYDARWERNRLAFLVEHPACVLCGVLASQADHWPRSRRQLVAAGVPDPDAWHRLRPLCNPCHGRETQRLQPSAWCVR